MRVCGQHTGIGRYKSELDVANSPLRGALFENVEMAQVIYDGEHESASPIGGFANYRHILD